jgi:predicted DNA binding CopG/RHH family protein
MAKNHLKVISFKISEEDYAALKDMSEYLNIGYTTLIRNIVKSKLAREKEYIS